MIAADRAGRRAALACWAVTRAGLLAIAVAGPAGIRANLNGDPYLYQLWSAGLLHGHFPLHDPRWQYPPAAALALAAPGVLPGSYQHALWALVLGTDLAVELLLIRQAGRPGGSARGLWVWTLVLPLIGPLLLDRFDVLPAALTVAAGAAEALPAVCALLLGLAILVKVWPAVLLGLPLSRRGGGSVGPRGRRRRQPRRPSRQAGLAAATGYLPAAGGYLAAAGLTALLLAPGGLVVSSVRAFVDHQSSRGLQIEAIAALPVMVHAAVHGQYPAVAYQDGSDQLTDPRLATVAHVCAGAALAALVLTALGGLLLARRGAGGTAVLDLALAGLLVTLDLAEVLSPQYLVWVVGLAAAALVRRDSRQAPAAVAIAVACPLTAAVFPFLYSAYVDGRALPVALEGCRDAALLAGTGLALARVRWSAFAGTLRVRRAEGSH